MSKVPKPHLFLLELQDALDTKRTRLGLTWSQVADQVSVHLGKSKIAVSTIQRVHEKRTAEGDGVVQMLLWLQQEPCLALSDATQAQVGELVAPPDHHILRFDSVAIYRALDRKRTSLNLSWSEVASQVGGGVSAATLRSLGEPRRVQIPPVLAILRWLGQPISDFVVVIPHSRKLSKQRAHR